MLYSYQAMNQVQQHATKLFLGLNREHHKTFYIQEKLLKGLVEAPRATIGIASRGSSMSESMVQTPPKSPLVDVSDSNEPAIITISRGNSGLIPPSPSRPPLRKKSLPTTPTNGTVVTNTFSNSSSNESTERRKIAYRVKLGSVGSAVLDSPKSIVVPSKFVDTNENVTDESDQLRAALIKNDSAASTRPKLSKINTNFNDNNSNISDNFISPNNQINDSQGIDDATVSTLSNFSSKVEVIPQSNKAEEEKENEGGEVKSTKCSCIIL